MSRAVIVSVMATESTGGSNDAADRRRAARYVAPFLALGLVNLGLLLRWGLDPLWAFAVLPPMVSLRDRLDRVPPRLPGAIGRSGPEPVTAVRMTSRLAARIVLIRRRFGVDAEVFW